MLKKILSLYWRKYRIFWQTFFCAIPTIQWQENIAFNYSECFLFCKLSLYECKFKCQPRKWDDFFPMAFLSATDIRREIEHFKPGIAYYIILAVFFSLNFNWPTSLGAFEIPNSYFNYTLVAKTFITITQILI